MIDPRILELARAHLTDKQLAVWLLIHDGGMSMRGAAIHLDLARTTVTDRYDTPNTQTARRNLHARRPPTPRGDHRRMSPATDQDLQRIRERIAEHFRTGATIAVKYETMPTAIALDASFAFTAGPFRVICERTMIDPQNDLVLGIVLELQELA